MNDKIFLSSNLKHLRIINGKTQEDIGKLCNKKNTAISNWEKGIRAPDNIDLIKLSDYFSVPIDDLMSKDLRKESIDEYRRRRIIAMFDDLQEVTTDINNLDKIEESVSKDIFDFLDLDFMYSPNSEQEIDFGLNDYSNLVQLYDELKKRKIVSEGKALTNKSLNDVITYIEKNKVDLKNILDKKKDQHFIKWNQFIKSPLYKEYVKDIEEYD